MNDPASAVLSVCGDARRLVAPDYVVLDAAITSSRQSKPDALRTVASALDRLTADLASRGAVALSGQTERRPLTWSAWSATTRVEHDHNKKTGRYEPTGQVVASVAVSVTLRALELLDALSAILASHESLNVDTGLLARRLGQSSLAGGPGRRHPGRHPQGPRLRCRARRFAAQRRAHSRRRAARWRRNRALPIHLGHGDARRQRRCGARHAFAGPGPPGTHRYHRSPIYRDRRLRDRTLITLTRPAVPPLAVRSGQRDLEVRTLIVVDNPRGA